MVDEANYRAKRCRHCVGANPAQQQQQQQHRRRRRRQASAISLFAELTITLRSRYLQHDATAAIPQIEIE